MRPIDPVVVITILGGAIVVLLIVGAPIKPLRMLGQIGIKFVIGGLLLFFVNVFGALIDLHVPINFITAAVSGFLGIPGLALLVAIQQLVLS
ncbi:inhibitor of the pro-sigma K processing machinery [Halalkalibacterium halodurans C-125]|uniref:Inhibitor of the pro-sigma K processing machinery n=1 Tax=Halalkalibacterium halodurans (strain ATCC BAA-125 / DSM 18197 / FERM 7344 / JCM 9153 / C-125) TaxID=272558 RepID=Q9KGM2_HALH5|nr:inhibitor of the pro-sigma K processing machinery [Halalkalibacterium halodurans C-125]